MIVKGVELNDVDFDNLLIEVDLILKKSKNFNSPTYTNKVLKSINDLWIFVKPTQLEFIELLQPLNIIWVDCEIKVNTEI